MEWINVNDGLPEDDDFFMVFDTNLGIVVRPFSAYHNCWDDEDGDDYYTDAIGGKITHWMELPKIPMDK